MSRKESIQHLARSLKSRSKGENPEPSADKSKKRTVILPLPKVTNGAV
jgi:hypothetical protein